RARFIGAADRQRCPYRAPAHFPGYYPISAKSAHSVLGPGVVDRAEGVEAVAQNGPRERRNRARVEPGHDRLVRARDGHGLAGTDRLERTRRRLRLEPHELGALARPVVGCRDGERADADRDERHAWHNAIELLVGLA